MHPQSLWGTPCALCRGLHLCCHKEFNLLAKHGMHATRCPTQCVAWPSTCEVGAAVCRAADIQRATPEAGHIRLQLPNISRLTSCLPGYSLQGNALVGARPQT